MIRAIVAKNGAPIRSVYGKQTACVYSYTDHVSSHRWLCSLEQMCADTISPVRAPIAHARLTKLVSVITGPPDLIVVTDALSGVHPTLHEPVVGLLRNVCPQDTTVYLQVSCPYIVDQFDAAEVFCVAMNGAYATLDKHPDWPRFDGVLAAGEFWSTSGEDWVTGL